MKIFLFCLLILTNLVAQPDFNLDPRVIQAGKFYNSEIHYFPSDKTYKVFYSYKISYSQLFFEKSNDEFKAGIKVNLEILDSLDKTLSRVFDDRKISTNNFELTNSESTFFQGLINFDITAGKYKILAIISDGTSKRERRIPPIDLEIDSAYLYLNPIVVENGFVKDDNSDWAALTNNSNSIPFNKSEAELLIPVIDSRIDSLIISIKQGEAFLVSDKIIKNFINCKNELKIVKDIVGIKKNSDSAGIKCFVFNDISSQLDEGPVQVLIKRDSKDEPKEFNLNVIWINKPLSLTDPEIAIKILELIETKSTVSDILSAKGDDKDNLFNYWKPKDPTPHTRYNELMNEFYSRVDYCDEEFKTISGNGGAKSDRGKIYIKYGAPDSINRDTNSEDKIVETWLYEKTNKKFLFIDKDGTGKFLLAESK